jgi:spore germination cell wall hydrolase CwlJ-like protein
MVKYMRHIIFALAALIGLASVGLVTYDKLRDLRIKKESTPYQFVTVKDRERQLQCMTKNIYYEAGGEPAEGKLAVAQVVLNRVESGLFADDPCTVIHQKNVVYNRVVCQFSWLCEDTHKIRPVHQKVWDESYEAAKMVLLEGFRLPALKGALYFHADYITPPQWKKVRVAKIGRHIFYKDSL